MSVKTGTEQSNELAARVLREVIKPYLAEHERGEHGPRDPALAMTVVLAGLTRAMIPTLVQATDIARQRTMIDAMVQMLNEGAADFRAHIALKNAARTVQ